MRSSHRSLAASVEFDPEAAELKRSRLAAAASVALRSKLPIVGGVLVGMTMLALGGTAVAMPTPIGLGSATNDAVVSSAEPTNAGVVSINGDVAVSPIASQSGFGQCGGSPCVNYQGSSTLHLNDPGGVAAQAVADETAARLAAQNATPSTHINDPALGNTTILGGVYSVGAADITGTLTLDAANNPDSVWIFNATSSITTASGSSVVFTRTAGRTDAQMACNVFWTAVSLVTLGSGSSFVGTVMAQAGVHVSTTVTVLGRLMAGTDVTLQNGDTIDKGNCMEFPAGSGGTPSTSGATGFTGFGTGGGTAATPIVATPQTAG